MANLTLARPLTPASIVASHGTATDQNLMTDDPREYWIGTSAGVVTFTIDLGSVQSVSAIFAGYANAPAGSTWSATGGPTTGLETTLFTSTSFPGKHALATFAAVSARYVKVTITPASGTLQAGILFAGVSFQPTWGHEWGAGRPIIDTGSRDRLLGGGFGINRGVIVSGYQWDFGDLTDIETEALYTFLKEVGASRPVAIAEDPAVTTDPTYSNRLHYGLMTIDKYERLSPGRTRWSLAVEDWL